MIHDSKKFTINHKQNTMSAEMSDLNPAPFMWEVFTKDKIGTPIQIGISIKSARTGVVTTWLYFSKEVDDEGETVLWTLLPSMNTILKQPQMANWKVVIYND